MGRPPTNPVDILQVEALLSDDERMMRDTVRRFVHDRVLPDIAKWFEAGEFPREIIPELGSLGLLGMQLTGDGGAGANPVSYGVTCMELEAGHSGMRSAAAGQGA